MLWNVRRKTMKKSAVLSVVFAGVMIIIGFCMMLGCMCTYHYRPMMGGYMMTYQDVFAGYQTIRMIFAAALFLGGVLMLCLSGYLFSKVPCGCKKTVEAEPQPKVEAQAEKEQPQPQPEDKA